MRDCAPAVCRPSSSGMEYSACFKPALALTDFEGILDDVSQSRNTFSNDSTRPDD